MAFCMLFDGSEDSGDGFFFAAREMKLSTSRLPVFVSELMESSAVRGLGGREFDDLCLDWSEASGARSCSCFLGLSLASAATEIVWSLWWSTESAFFFLRQVMMVRSFLMSLFLLR